MPGEGSSSPLPRLALSAGRVLLLPVLVIVRVLLMVLRPILFAPLVLASLGGAGFALYCLARGRFELAGQIGITAAVAWAGVSVFAIVAQAADPRYFERDARRPPWWWPL